MKIRNTAPIAPDKYAPIKCKLYFISSDEGKYLTGYSISYKFRTERPIHNQFSVFNVNIV